DIDHHAIGFIGHSEGGMVGPIAAAGNAQAAFVVMLAGPGVGVDQLLLSQRRAAALAQGMPPAQAEKADTVFRDIFQAVRAANGEQDGVRRILQLLTPAATQALGLSDSRRTQLAQQMSGPWMRYILNYQPADTLARIRVPVLALNGSLDQQVPA